MKRSTVVRGVAAVAALPILAACGGDGGDGATSSSSTVLPTAPSSSSSADTSTSAASSSSDGSSTSVTIPPEAQEDTPKGAGAFGKFYFEQTGVAIDTGNTSLLKKLYRPTCAPCKDLVASTEADLAKGVTMNKNPYTVTVESVSERADGDYRVMVNVKFADYREQYSDGKLGRTADPGQFVAAARVSRQSGSWMIYNWVLTQ